MKRCSQGSKIRRRLKRLLKAHTGRSQKPRRLVSASCFGLCPKKAVVLASGGSLSRGDYVLISDRHHVDDAMGLLETSAGSDAVTPPSNAGT